MTMPNERINAIKNTREFLRSLLDPKQTPRVPRSVRLGAYWCLKHYPGDYYLKEVIDECRGEYNSHKPTKKSK